VKVRFLVGYTWQITQLIDTKPSFKIYWMKLTTSLRLTSSSLGFLNIATVKKQLTLSGTSTHRHSIL